MFAEIMRINSAARDGFPLAQSTVPHLILEHRLLCLGMLSIGYQFHGLFWCRNMGVSVVCVLAALCGHHGVLRCSRGVTVFSKWLVGILLLMYRT